MRYKSTHKSVAREQILVAAERLLRLHGLEGVGIDAVMAEAGMTSGAFYSQFKSKKELLSAVLERGFSRLSVTVAQVEKSDGPYSVVERYLSESMCQNIAGGCSITPLLADLVRADSTTKFEMKGHLENTVHDFSLLFDDSSKAAEGEAWAVLALMVGGLQLARATDDKELSVRILKSCKQFVRKRV